MDPDQMGMDPLGGGDVAALTGQGPAQSGPFDKRDLAKLTQVLLLVATEGTGNTHDGAIARKLIGGQPLEKGELQHIMDEVRRLKDLPKDFDPVLEKVFHVLSS
jgi:hypothetical protein